MVATGAQATTPKPVPATAARAIALVRASPDTAQAAAPFARELGWSAQWRETQWWVAGAFTSQWGKRFVVSATLERGRVEADGPFRGPTKIWIRQRLRRFNLTSLYTRFTAAAAIASVGKNVGIDSYTVIDAAARVAQDTPTKVGWYFIFYVQNTDGTKSVLPVVGLSGNPVQEGQYVDGYGFGGQPSRQTTVPLNLSDWVHAVAKARGWQAPNL